MIIVETVIVSFHAQMDVTFHTDHIRFHIAAFIFAP